MNKIKHDYALVAVRPDIKSRMVMCHYKTRKEAFEHWHKYVLPAFNAQPKGEELFYRLIDMAQGNRIVLECAKEEA